PAFTDIFCTRYGNCFLIQVPKSLYNGSVICCFRNQLQRYKIISYHKGKKKGKVMLIHKTPLFRRL
ncbi:MAG: hypothetical protein IIT63_05620, partial [Prevotella sp.]|nr:hypothetical protein [Prevotella sp.]